MLARDNPAKKREWWKKWYQNNKATKIAWQDKRRKELRAWLVELKKTLKCSRCPENHPACLVFHHIDPKTKELEISYAVNNNWSIKKIEAEIAKCEVLCANCHMKHHHGV